MAIKRDKETQKERLAWWIKIAYCPICGHAWRVHFDSCMATKAVKDGKPVACGCTEKR